ncbi:hypothetical protein GCM10007862_35240 [Dyella lipolytica]|uniref:Uncharacterized protein n=2 Tax=Dyella lipolytica TaxID=1867835 RepID=A0ABW8IX24_9GAMM|nr:hypothetical protein GCM10007862_35240 [Dyella lipolytica]
MTDTIDLLEAIGRDASLRHASTEELTAMLEKAQAPEALTVAVASGDSSQLSKELGCPTCEPPQSTQTPGHEEEPAEEEPLETPAPDKSKTPSKQ